MRLADDIDALAEEEQELEVLVETLDKTCRRYKMEISAEKTKVMTNSADGIQREFKVKEQKLGTVTSFKYFGLNFISFVYQHMRNYIFLQTNMIKKTGFRRKSVDFFESVSCSLKDCLSGSIYSFIFSTMHINFKKS